MNKQIIEEAAEWFVEFSTGHPDRATKQAFDAWLRQSPQHVRVYLELLPLWEDAAMPVLGQNAGADELIARARQPERVVTWQGSKGSAAPSGISPTTIPQNARTPILFRSQITRVVAASFTLAIISIVVLLSLTLNGQTYATDIGEQRIVKLEDGSTLELNTASRVRVHFSKTRRDVELSKGQALFHVAKDPTRPFIVASADARIRAVGTEFDVYRRESGTTVTVLEGRVAILNSAARDPAGRADSVPLSAGEQITVNAPIYAANPPTPHHTNVTTATAWTQHRLIFDVTPLTEVAAEFNRYNTRHLIVEGSELSDFHVSGSFGSTDPSSLLRFLEAQPGLSVRESATDIHISSQ